jgi:hypothetical protein
MAADSDSGSIRGGRQTSRLDQDWLRGMTREELVDMLIEIALALKSKSASDSTHVPATVYAVPSDFPEYSAHDFADFVSLPFASIKSPKEAMLTLWRVVLIPHEVGQIPLALEVYDDAKLGRLAQGVRIDIDLTAYGAEELGVSREHAMLRPEEDSLLLFDLGSANGTYCNGIRAKLGHFLRLEDGDVMSFGQLHFKIMIITRPGA